MWVSWTLLRILMVDSVNHQLNRTRRWSQVLQMTDDWLLIDYWAALFPVSLLDLTFLHESCKTFHGELVNFEKMVSGFTPSTPQHVSCQMNAASCGSSSSSVSTEAKYFNWNISLPDLNHESECFHSSASTCLLASNMDVLFFFFLRINSSVWTVWINALFVGEATFYMFI